MVVNILTIEILTLHLAYFSYGNKRKLGSDGSKDKISHVYLSKMTKSSGKISLQA